MKRILLCGAAGRMGRAIATAVAESPELALAAALEDPAHPACGTRLGEVRIEPDTGGALPEADCLVEFTRPAAMAGYLQRAAEQGCPFLSGTTGLGEVEEAALAAAAARIPVLHASNMSLGIAVLGDLVAHAAERLPGHEIEIVEMHHRGKRDAPSGTALDLVQRLRQVRRTLAVRYGRRGATGPRPAEEVGLHALRGGDVVGEHRVILAGAGERLVLGHIAESRAAFVAGVLTAIRFLVDRSPGRYTMGDVRPHVPSA